MVAVEARFQLRESFVFFRGVLEPAWTAWQEPVVKFSGILELVVKHGHYFKIDCISLQSTGLY